MEAPEGTQDQQKPQMTINMEQDITNFYILVDAKATEIFAHWRRVAKTILALLRNTLRKLQPLVKLAYRFQHVVRLYYTHMFVFLFYLTTSVTMSTTTTRRNGRETSCPM